MAKLPKVAETAIARVQLAEMREAALAMALRGLHDQHRGIPKEYRGAIDIITMALHRRTLDAYRHLMMVARIEGGAQSRAAADKAVRRFFGEGQAIMQHLTMSGDHPGRWLSREHEAFRLELDEALDRLADLHSEGTSDEQRD